MYVLDNIYICNDVYVYVHSHAFFIFHCNELCESEKLQWLQVETAHCLLVLALGTKAAKGWRRCCRPFKAPCIPFARAGIKPLLVVLRNLEYLKLCMRFDKGLQGFPLEEAVQ